MIKEPKAVLVTNLFRPLQERLLTMLAGLTVEEWQKPTVCVPWTVRDLTAHLLADDLGVLSRQRDGYSQSGVVINNWEELVNFINRQNEQWVQATRRLSPQVLMALLRESGEQLEEYYRTVDLYRLGQAVSWAGPEPAPVWLDVAREYTERWHHQQQIRDALGYPDLLEPELFGPVLAAFVRALPYTFRDTPAEEGTVISLKITGEAGSGWSIQREGGNWKLYEGLPDDPATLVTLPEDKAWRLFTRVISPAEARPFAEISGNREYGLRMLEMVSIIV